MEKNTEYPAPTIPKIMINQFSMIIGIDNFPLNSLRYNKGGSTNAIIADPKDPAIFKKSVKLGINSEIPVTSHTITDLTPIFLSFIDLFVPFLKNECSSYISKAAKI